MNQIYTLFHVWLVLTQTVLACKFYSLKYFSPEINIRSDEARLKFSDDGNTLYINGMDASDNQQAIWAYNVNSPSINCYRMENEFRTAHIFVIIGNDKIFNVAKYSSNQEQFIYSVVDFGASPVDYVWSKYIDWGLADCTTGWPFSNGWYNSSSSFIHSHQIYGNNSEAPDLVIFALDENTGAIVGKR